jgi:hypothetical protein
MPPSFAAPFGAVVPEKFAPVVPVAPLSPLPAVIAHRRNVTFEPFTTTAMLESPPPASS